MLSAVSRSSQAEVVAAFLNSSEVSEEQRRVCSGNGCFVVSACPGSGKTRTVGTLLARRIANWHRRRSGIAALSFTNVARDEIAAELRRFGIVPSWPHFLGTIDSFVNGAVFLPLGHLVMKCRRRPEIAHPRGSLYAWLSQHMIPKIASCRDAGCKATLFEYQSNGQLRWCGKLRRPKCDGKHCETIKKQMTDAGFALPEDAMYFAAQLLRRADIRQAVAARYREIVVDEAQDTSEAQVEILKSLANAGCDVVLVGDPDQAIFEFNGARPDLFKAFSDTWPVMPLSANFRSSNSICRAAWLFTDRSKGPARAEGNDKDYPTRPALWKYKPGMEAALSPRFLAVLESLNIAAPDAAVLARTHSTVNAVQGIQQPEWPDSVRTVSRMLARAAAYRDVTDYRCAHGLAMDALLRVCFDRASLGPGNSVIENIGIRRWRRETWRLLTELPSADVVVRDWGPKARAVVQEFLKRTGWPVALKLGSVLNACNTGKCDLPVRAFCQTGVKAGLQYLVIHEAKGRTFEAVMLVAKGPGKKGQAADLVQWLHPTCGDDEERRIAYVGVTRPRKLLVLAVPSTTPAGLIEELRDYMDVPGTD